MRMILSLLLALFLTQTSSIILYDNQESNNHSAALQLPLYHVRQLQSDSPQTTLPFYETLIPDDARVQFLSSLLSGKRNLTSSLDDESVHIPVRPISVNPSYFTLIRIGSSPATHPVFIDTGSTLNWIYCVPSDTYPKVPCLASQCRALEQVTRNSIPCPNRHRCDYTTTYGDGSYSKGYLGMESLTFGSESLPRFFFGCGMSNQVSFGMDAGIIGLSKHKLSLWNQLSHKYGNTFAYCLPTFLKLGKTRSGGFLSIGTSSNVEYKFTPMIYDSRDPTLYFVKLTAVSVAGIKFKLPTSDYNVPMLIDSGVRYSLFPSPVYSFLKKELVRIISHMYRITAAPANSFFDVCFVGSLSEISSVVPPVQLVFLVGARLNLAPYNVVIEIGSDGTTCLSFGDSSKAGHLPIIGSHQQQTFNIMYDIGSSRIGFASGGCH